jgi:glutaredoxin
MPKITIYTAPECPHSKGLKEFLSELAVEYDEKCILTSSETAIELKELSGHIAVPTTVVDDSVFVGYDRRAERRIKRKLGV